MIKEIKPVEVLSVQVYLKAAEFGESELHNNIKGVSQSEVYFEVHEQNGGVTLYPHTGILKVELYKHL